MIHRNANRMKVVVALGLTVTIGGVGLLVSQQASTQLSSVIVSSAELAPLSADALTEAYAGDAFKKILETPEEEWLALPWADRKPLIEQATWEVLAQYGNPTVFKGWSDSDFSLADYREEPSFSPWTFSVETEDYLMLSEEPLQHRNPEAILDSILHETAHSIVGAKEGHGEVFQEAFREMREQAGLKQPSPLVHAPLMTEAELESCGCGSCC